LLQGNGILRNASAYHVTGQDFQLYPAIESHSASNVNYHADVRVLHIEPVTHQEVQEIQQHSSPDVSKLEGIVATSEHFKHRDLDATIAVHATERKHDRYHFHWYFTIFTLVSILLTMICNGYPYLFRNLLHRIRCSMQPVVNSKTGDKSKSLPETFPEEQPSTSQLQFSESGRKSEFVTYSVQWPEAEITNRQHDQDEKRG
jgi:hypothetical protein